MSPREKTEIDSAGRGDDTDDTIRPATSPPSDDDERDVNQLEKGDPPTHDDDEDVVEPSALYATNSSVNQAPPPDGGLAAWIQVSMGWIVIFTTWGYINSFGAFQAYYITVLPESASTISWIGAVQVWLTFVIGAFSGRLLDAGYFLPTFTVGASLHVLGIFMMSLSDRYWKLMLTQGLVTGLGNGIIFTPCMALVATYWDKKRAFAIGLVTTGNSAGGLVYPAIVRGVLPKLGFGWTARVLGFINLGGLLLVGFFMRPRLAPRTNGPIIELSAFKEPIYACYVGGLFCFIWVTYYTLYYLASFGLSVIGMPYTDAATLITIVNGVGMPFRVLVPILASRIGTLNTLTIMAFATSIVAWCWIAVTTLPGVYIFSTFYGVATASFQCLMPTGMASITPKLNKVGTRLGMAFTVSSIAGLTGPPLGGAIEQSSPKGYIAAHGWAAAVTMIAAALMGASRLFKTGLKLKAVA